MLVEAALRAGGVVAKGTGTFLLIKETGVAMSTAGPLAESQRMGAALLQPMAQAQRWLSKNRGSAGRRPKHI